MKNKNGPAKGKSTPRISDTIIVAILGLVGTVAVALIGLWGIYVQNKPPVESTPTVQAEPTIQTETPNLFSEVVSVYARPECGSPYTLPEYIDPIQDFDQAMSEVDAAFNRGDDFPTAPTLYRYPDNEFVPEGEFTFRVTVTSQAPVDWIKIDKKTKIMITDQQIPEEPINTIYYPEGCGGLGEDRDFRLDNNLLVTDFPSYTLNAAYENENADYFTLQPGEFESFLFTLQCGDPGSYNVQFQIPVEYQSKQGSVSADVGEVLCPAVGAHWDTTHLIGRFKWDGSQYIPDQP